MRNFSLHLFGTIVLSVLVVSIAISGGYQINEQGARAAGMGGAFVARASDPSAIYYNPAGLASQKGINFLGGINLMLPSTKFKNDSVDTKTVGHAYTPINVYGTYQVDDNMVLGLGVYNPFGLGTDWEDRFDYAPVRIKFRSAKSDLKVYYINPSIGYKINDELSVGLGISYVYASVGMWQNVSTTSTGVTTMSLEGTGSGINLNLGVIYKPMQDLSLGISYRTKTSLDLKGDAKLGYWVKADGKATLPMPATLLAGVAYNVTEDITMEADFQLTQWSAYDQLKVEFTPATTALGAGGATDKKWNNGYTFRGGLEYKMDEETTLRLGGALDLSPQPPSRTEPMIPDGDRMNFTVGASIKVNETTTLDFGYLLVVFLERDAKGYYDKQYRGVYNTTTHIFGLNLAYALGN